MHTVIARLNEWINELPGRLAALEEELALKPQPQKWSKKEILGHLCDSATNNYQRFVRAQYEKSPFIVPKYDQNQWVAVNDYQNMAINDIIKLWTTLNGQIVAVVSGLPEEKRNLPCEIGGAQPVTLEWLIRDYLDHMEHHVRQILA
ncbi:DinB family protein [Paenibacillus sedimenti]|uniref:DinB family protein n=1 Tax=Paenibacillus sedimenti TaxID=2770274 RepID=A0A926KVK9_9BACL|nr:DinB family protein [Paenibacillus sedimenti]MBD0383691.1 DinB family protein [Paenibacillus sedimenti]